MPSVLHRFQWFTKLYIVLQMHLKFPINFLVVYSPPTLSLSLLLFSGSEVMLSGYEEEKATVVGIDKYGYLQVLRKSGETVACNLMELHSNHHKE